jgi:hypothetical protein
MSNSAEMWRTLRLVVIVGAIGAGLYFLVVAPMERGLASTRNDVGRGLEKVLQAVTHSDTTIVEGRAEISETAEISELALLEMKMSATRSFENEGYLLRYVPTGTKKVIVRGEYKVKAGYKLKPGISLAVENGRPVARFPKPEILSVELLNFEVLSEQDGWFNKVKPKDREMVLLDLRNQMRNEARRSGMLDTVEATLRNRLSDLLGDGVVTLEESLP